MVAKRYSVFMATAWALVAFITSVAGLPARAADLRTFLTAMVVAGVVAAAGAALALHAGRRYVAGMLLILSAFTPTGVPLLNLAVLIVGFALAVRATRTRPVPAS